MGWLIEDWALLRARCHSLGCLQIFLTRHLSIYLQSKHQSCPALLSTDPPGYSSETAVVWMMLPVPGPARVCYAFGNKLQSFQPIWFRNWDLISGFYRAMQFINCISADPVCWLAQVIRLARLVERKAYGKKGLCWLYSPINKKISNHEDSSTTSKHAQSRQSSNLWS